MKLTIANLKKLRDNSSGLKEEVLNIILDEVEPDYIDTWFQDLFNHGCISGMVGKLIYYADTHAFAKEFMDEILDLEQEYKDNTGIEVEPQNDRLNWYAWFGFEETARKIYEQDFGLEY